MFEDGVLTISGEGEITKWPWKSEYGSQITQIIIEEGVTAIQSGGQYNPIFGSCTSLDTVTYCPQLLKLLETGPLADVQA